MPTSILQWLRSPAEAQRVALRFGPRSGQRASGIRVTTDLSALLAALYVKIDDEIGGTRRPGRPPLLSDSELVCLAFAQALLGYHSQARWLRYANKHLTGMFLAGWLAGGQPAVG
jgi:hypothetical protein